MHPYAAGQDALKEALGGLVGALTMRRAEAATLALELPSWAKGPLPSPELILEEEVEMEMAGFQTWEVATLALQPAEMMDALLNLPDYAPRETAYSATLRFWTTAARLAYELVARQCYMPTARVVRQAAVKPSSKSAARAAPVTRTTAVATTTTANATAIRAAWEAVLAPEDAERVASLAKLMPPACWSFLPAEQRKASLPKELLRGFLNASIDAYVRGSISAKELLPNDRYSRYRRNQDRPLPERWLLGLVSENPIVPAPPQELSQFATSMQNWLAQVRPGGHDAPFRTCFRLDAPTMDGLDGLDGQNGQKRKSSPTWHVGFFLQANDDRSLLVPAEKVWKERSSTLTFLKRSFENPQERLLADLGRASRLFPAIESSLKTARPDGLKLDTEQAYRFLRESAPLLEQSGYGVLVPPWWQKPAARLGVKLKIKPKAGANTPSDLLGLDSLVAYDWTVSVGDMTLSEQEFEQLVNLKLPLIQVRGQWVELRPEEIEKAIAFFKKKHKDGTMSLGEALRTGLGEEESELGLPVTDVEGEGWIRGLLDQLADGAQIAQIEQPASLHGTLRPYQLKGVSWLAFLRQFGFGGCLADDMGLGKTIALISLLLHDREVGFGHGPTLIICPMSIVGNWHRELQRFAPSLKVMIHHGHERLSGEAFAEEARQHDIVITTYSLALRDKEHLNLLDWQYAVLDEAQNIKNESAKQTQAIKSLSASNRIALTGTPVENRLSELWSIMQFLNPGYLGAAEEFRKRFAIPIERYHEAERADVLRRVIQPFVLRRLKTDKAIIADLPDKMEMKVYCNLTQEQASLYEAVVKDMLEQIEQSEGIQRRGLILSTLMKLKQVCNHPAQFVADGSSLPGRSGKLARLEEMLEEVLAAGDKALIFSQFAEMGGMLRHYLQESLGREVLFLHGGTPKKLRDSIVQRFQEERRGPPLFILSLKAGGVGLNLTAANHVFHYDRWWNPAVENQATDRAFRIGQRKDVQVHKFVCVGTLEERIDLMIEQKKELAESIVGSGENWLTEMSTAQLRDLFALSREAVGE